MQVMIMIDKVCDIEGCNEQAAEVVSYEIPADILQLICAPFITVTLGLMKA
jgi:hypothetical protein